MFQYVFNTNADKNDRHEIHTSNCQYKPSPNNSISIGYCSNCHDAISKAKAMQPSKNFDGCYYCCNTFHKG